MVIDKIDVMLLLALTVGVPSFALAPILIINSYPSQEGIIIGNIEKNGNTECILVANNQTMTTNEEPCLHKRGDIVMVRVDATGAEILREAHGKECEPAWYTTMC